MTAIFATYAEKHFMNYSELCRLKDTLLKDVRRNTRPEDFDNYEEYALYVEGIEEGIMRFFSQSMLEFIETDAA